MNSQASPNRNHDKQIGQSPASQNQNAKKGKDAPEQVQPSAAAPPSQKQNEPAKAARLDKVGSAEEHNLSHARTEEQKEHSFRLEAPHAREVLLAADFTDWDKHPIKLIKGGGGVWHTKIPLAPGRHLYRFVVDGEWKDDPHTTHRVPNSFGSDNSVVDIH